MMIIAERFNGPPESGHGGYSAGVFSSVVGHGGPVEVTLRRPPPLNESLTVVGTHIHAPNGDLVAEVAPAPPFQAMVPPVSYPEAVQAAKSYPGFTQHPFPTCYVCGPLRDDGLGIFPTPLTDGRTTAPFVSAGDLPPETVWAMLDCPGGWAIATTGRICVLGRIAVDIAALPNDGHECVVMGETVSTQGRKALVHTTLYGPDGQPLAQARATWIALQDIPAPGPGD
jgi:hypothetical protein